MNSVTEFSHDFWPHIFSFFFSNFLFYCQIRIQTWANKKHPKRKQASFEVSALFFALSAVTLVFICPEKPLEEEDLQISSHDDDKALKDRPGVHIVGLGLKQEVISPSAHACYIIEAPHMLDSKSYLICDILGKERQSKILYWRYVWNRN